mmetsp:Transcript_71059/g.171607  ORF Transcript_71059/g.171607 Transcript_71059/m.171607 type:complete len:460 (+) Transcript_71059:68-1447(+)
MLLSAAVLGRLESREGSQALSSASSSEAGASHASKACDKGPYVLDTLHYTHEGLGSSIWPHATSIIFADAIGAPYIDSPPHGAQRTRANTNIPGQEQTPAMIWNSHDYTDYSTYLGFGRNAAGCNYLSLMDRVKKGELRMVQATPEMYGDHTSEYSHDHDMQPSLRDLCSLIAHRHADVDNARTHTDASTAATVALLKDPLLRLAAKGNLSETVFRFGNYGDHRFTGATDCLYNPHFRGRYHNARALRSAAGRGIERPRDELWLSVHYRAGDVAHKKRAFVKGNNGDLRGLARYAKAAEDWLATDPERLQGRGRGLKVVVHLFSEGAVEDFKSFTDVLPDAILHLGNYATQSSHESTMRDIDLMTQSHLLIGGHSTFFQLAVHLCDSCVVASQAVASDAERIDEAVGAPWPRAYTLVNLHHHDSAANQDFEELSFGSALAKVLGSKKKEDKTPFLHLEP